MTQANLSNRDVSAQIARLFVYPVKSCAGVEVREALLTDTGLDLDRAWMVVDAQGLFMTQREHPRLALVRPHIKTHELVLNAPEMPDLHITFEAEWLPISVKVWNDNVPAFDMGETAAQWFTKFLSLSEIASPAAASYRLVRFNPEHRRVSSLEWTGDARAYNQFSDGFPLLVLGDASHAQLNERLVAAGHAIVSIERFRPNIVLSGLQVHDEDWLREMYVDAGAAEVVLKPVKPCPRCPIPNVNPLTAEINREVGDTLQSYRKDTRLGGAVTFGMNTIVIRGVGEMLRIGQKVSADFV